MTYGSDSIQQDAEEMGEGGICEYLVDKDN